MQYRFSSPSALKVCLLGLALSLGLGGCATDMTHDTAGGTPKFGGSSPSTSGGATNTVKNPSGNCVAPDDGSRHGYHSSEGATWLVDCEPVLTREYWRVFVESGDVAYMIPRPDSTGLTYGHCNGTENEHLNLFKRNGLCDKYGDPEIINSMTPSDALAIAHILHESLVFEISDHLDGTTSIVPFAPDSDLADACQVKGVQLDVARDVCARIVDRQEADFSIGSAWLLSLEEATELAEALNLLYGIK